MKRPLLRYHGGKWRIAEWIIGHFPKHRIYVEPFGGGGSVLLCKPRSRQEVYNDLDGEMVNLFRVVRDRGDDLVKAIVLTPYAREEFYLSYERCDEELERARRTLVRAWMGLGMRETRVGFRAVGMGTQAVAMEWRGYGDALSAIIERMRGVVIESKEACEVMVTYDADDALHYVDPPYVQSTRTELNNYRHEMDDGAHERLAGVLHGLKGAVVLSGYDNSLYSRLYGGWRSMRMDRVVTRGRHRTEVIWLSPQCPRAGLFDHEEMMEGECNAQ